MGRLIYTDNQGREILIPLGPEAPVVTIGRATDCTIRSNRKSVSRRHAEFRYNNGQYEVVDLQSSNGTYLIVNDNRQPVKPRAALAHNDEVWCGDFILHFEGDHGELGVADSDPTVHGNNNYNASQPAYNEYPPAAEVGFNPAAQNSGVSFGQPVNGHNPGYSSPSASASVNFAQPHQPTGDFGQSPIDYGQPPASYDNNPPVDFGQQGSPQQASFGQPIGGAPPASYDNNPPVDFGAAPANAAPADYGQPPASYDNNPPVDFGGQADFGQQENNQQFGATPFNPSMADAQNDPFANVGSGENAYPPDAAAFQPAPEPYNPAPAYEPAPAYDPAPANTYNPQPYNNGAANYQNPPPEYNQSSPSWADNDDTSHDQKLDQILPHLQQGTDAQSAQKIRELEERLSAQARELEERLGARTRELEDAQTRLRHAEQDVQNLRAMQSSNEGTERIQAELEATRQEQRRLEEKLHTALQNAARAAELETEVEMERSGRQRAEQTSRETQTQLDAAQGRVSSLEEEAREAARLRDELNTRTRALESSQHDLERARANLQGARDDADQVRSSAADALDSAQEADALRRELDRQKRLIEEFERRNRDLQSELGNVERERRDLQQQLTTKADALSELQATTSQQVLRIEELEGQNQRLSGEFSSLRTEHESSASSHQSLNEQVVSLETQLATTTSELEDAARARDEAQATLNTTQEQLASHEPDMRDLRNENEGLRRRLKLDKERFQDKEAGLQKRIEDLETPDPDLEARLARLVEAEELLEVQQGDIESLHEQLTQAQSQPSIPIESLTPILTKSEALLRLTDAIARTDISSLGTVDRIRLQSALRETDPSTTLGHIIASLRALLAE